VQVVLVQAALLPVLLLLVSQWVWWLLLPLLWLWLLLWPLTKTMPLHQRQRQRQRLLHAHVNLVFVKKRSCWSAFFLHLAFKLLPCTTKPFPQFFLLLCCAPAKG
jgi:hypothetical protein